LSRILGLLDSSYRIGVRREIGPKDREKRRICQPFGNPRQLRGGESQRARAEPEDMDEPLVE
jgi:hypothetical protein